MVGLVLLSLKFWSHTDLCCPVPSGDTLGWSSVFSSGGRLAGPVPPLLLVLGCGVMVASVLFSVGFRGLHVVIWVWFVPFFLYYSLHLFTLICLSSLWGMRGGEEGRHWTMLMGRALGLCGLGF